MVSSLPTSSVVSLNGTLPHHHTFFCCCLGICKVSHPLCIAASTVDDFAADNPLTSFGVL